MSHVYKSHPLGIVLRPVREAAEPAQVLVIRCDCSSLFEIEPKSAERVLVLDLKLVACERCNDDNINLFMSRRRL